MNNTDKLIDKHEGMSTAEWARVKFERTGERTSPYLMYPERESWQSFYTYEREDGSRYVEVIDCGRWGGEFRRDVYTVPVQLAVMAAQTG